MAVAAHEAKPLAISPRRSHDRLRRSLIGGLTLMLAAVLITPSAFAQRTKKAEKPKPRPVKLRTKDGVELQAFYFPSDKGKQAIPVLILHEWKGQAAPYAGLVKALNAEGCAVLVPVYRGHGNSKSTLIGREKKRNSMSRR